MTSKAALFHTYSLSSKNFMIQIADGSLSKVVEIGSVTITDDLVQNSILFIPLLSISNLAKDLNRVTKIIVNFRTWNRGG